MKKILFFLIVAGFVACNGGTAKTEEKAAAPAEIVQTSLSIGGMTCEHCVMSVTKGINELEGIAEVSVTLDDSTALVKYDAAVLNLDDIKAAVEKRGYTVKSAE